MQNFNIIKNKLEAFTRRYYTNELLKGAILFFAIGVLYFLFTLFIEHVLWLSTTARSILFWLFIAVEFALLVKFIALPVAKMFKLQKGIDYEDASKIIGKHFPNVNDKLLNVLQLQQNNSQSELLLASIEQKSLELKPIPFKLAVDFKKNKNYLKYAAIPIVIILGMFFTGKINWFSSSYDRIVHYKTPYEPPAPFQFFVVNDNLNAIENIDFKLIVKTVGDVVPENVQIAYNGETYFLQQKEVGSFEYVFSQPKATMDFQLLANKVNSKRYTLNVSKVPALLDFNMVLKYPAYTKKSNETLKSTGNAIVPEGTNIAWKLRTRSTENVFLYANDTVALKSKEQDVFETSLNLYNKLDYSLATSNASFKDYESLKFSIDVVKDQYPELKLNMVVDSLDMQTLYFQGQATDDYGLSKLQLVYYPEGEESNLGYVPIPISNSTIIDFISAFPNNIDIEDGIPYNLYFQVFDNDAINKSKSAKSGVFTYRKRTKEEETQKTLKEQSETIKDLNNSLKRFDEQDKILEELSKTQKEKSSLNFNDKKKLEAFLKRQKEQDELMQNFNKKLTNNLENFDSEEKEDLLKRLSENEERLKQDEELLKQLKDIQEEIKKEDLIDKLDELAKQNKNKKRSLEQLLELTKRFYVEKKLAKLQEELLKQAIEQEKLSNESEENNTRDKQEELNNKFEEFLNEKDELQKASDALKKPVAIPKDKFEEAEIKEEQNQASEELEKKEEKQASDDKEQSPSKKESLKKAQESQKKAAKKMHQMSQEMQQAMQAGGGEQLGEDIDMLRQILDNLVLFSFEQEDLMKVFKDIESDHNKFASHLRKQYELKEHFEHIDDSLFALSLRQPKLSEQVNMEISDVFFYTDKTLSQLAEDRISQGVSNQQFTITAANNLANMLSDVLDNMQANLSMSSKGSGEGDMELPDIIMSQEELNKMMQEGMENGKTGKPKDGDSEENEGDKKEGQGSGGDSDGALYDIYKQQQALREALKEKLDKEGSEGAKLLKGMEDVELDLLNKGFTNETLQKMMELKHQLLKLENATFEQGEDEKRKSITNYDSFNNNTNKAIPKAKQYFQTTEILNKQTLPLRQIYKKKVQEYFIQTND